MIVASFVTFDAVWPPAGDPAATLNGTTLAGVAHPYARLAKKEKRNYTLHFVPFRNLEAGAVYTYSVRGPAGAWSDSFAFRVPRDGAETRLAAFGDIGHSRWSAMTNLGEDCASGVIDAIIVLGDHAYNLGGASGRRGDAYMNAFQPTLARCPWLPLIGNHEGMDGDLSRRYVRRA